MKKIFFRMMFTFAMVCLLGITPSSAADKQKVVFGEKKHGIDNRRGPRKVSRVLRGIDGLSYDVENYTALEPYSGESYPLEAESVFYIDEWIYLVDMCYIGTPGNFTRYYFITDVVGTTVATFWDVYTFSPTGYYWSYMTVNSSDLGVGSYVYQSITLGPGEWIMSRPFTFTVEY